MKQEIVKGIRSLNRIIEECGVRKVLLVADSSFSFLNIKQNIESINVPFVLFNDFTSNPLYEDVCKGVDLFNNENCDAIIAIGGGSSIDVAKCIKLYCKLAKTINYLHQEYKDNSIPLIAIPTTAGTGSESTRYAVIYYAGIKQSVTHDSIVPNYAILEPSVLKTLPLYQKKCTMMDALCQGIESYWSVNSTDESKFYSKLAIEGIMTNWRSYIMGNVDEAAEKIMCASNYAGKAICITQTTAPHAFSYKITSLYGTPHGHAVAICLPKIWRYMLDNTERCIDTRGTKYLSGIFYEISELLGEKSPSRAIELLEKMISDMDLCAPISSQKGKDLNILSKSVNSVRLKNNPVWISEESIYAIYNEIVM